MFQGFKPWLKNLEGQLRRELMRIRVTCFAIICMVLLINTHINTDMVKWREQIIYKLKKRHYTRLRATDIALEREKMKSRE